MHCSSSLNSYYCRLERVWKNQLIVKFNKFYELFYANIYLCKNDSKRSVIWRSTYSKHEKIEENEKVTILKAIDNDVNNLPRVDSLNVEGNKLFIFDDLINCCASDMDKIADYYIASRKKNCTVVFITQDYTKLLPVIRTNANTIIITVIKAIMALRMCLIDISDGDYNKVTNLYKKRNVFIKTENDKGKILYALDSFKKCIEGC